MRESTLQAKIIRLLNSRGAYVIKTLVGNSSGIADITCCYRGSYVAIEVKSPLKEAVGDPLQIVHQQRVTKAGGISIITNSVDEVKELLDEITKVYLDDT